MVVIAGVNTVNIVSDSLTGPVVKLYPLFTHTVDFFKMCGDVYADRLILLTLTLYIDVLLFASLLLRNVNE